jgi:hypothetical protein
VRKCKCDGKGLDPKLQQSRSNSQGPAQHPKPNAQHPHPMPTIQHPPSNAQCHPMSGIHHPPLQHPTPNSGLVDFVFLQMLFFCFLGLVDGRHLTSILTSASHEFRLLGCRLLLQSRHALKLAHLASVGGRSSLSAMPPKEKACRAKESAQTIIIPSPLQKVWFMYQ